MKNLANHNLESSSAVTILHDTWGAGPSNSSAARWPESSAAPDCFATMIRNRIVFVREEEQRQVDFGSGQNPVNTET